MWKIKGVKTKQVQAPIFSQQPLILPASFSRWHLALQCPQKKWIGTRWNTCICSGKGSWVWLDYPNELSVPCTSDGSSGPEGLSQQHDGEHTALVLGSISWTLDRGDHQHWWDLKFSFLYVAYWTMTCSNHFHNMATSQVEPCCEYTCLVESQHCKNHWKVMLKTCSQK